MRLHGVGRQGNLLKHGDFEMELLHGGRRVRRSAEQTRLPETLGAAVFRIGANIAML